MSVIHSGSVASEAALPQLRTLRRKQRILDALQHPLRIVRANIDMAMLLAQHRPGASVARVVLAVLMIGTPFLMSWSTGQLIANIVQGLSVHLLDVAALGLMLALLVGGALPLMVAVVDRLIEHWAFVHVQQAQVIKVPNLDPVTYSDPSLKDKIQQVQERAVWRIMALVKSQVLLVRAIAWALISAALLARFDPWLCMIVVGAMLPSMLLEGRHAYRQFKVDERQGEWWRRFWEDRDYILNSKTLAYLQVFGAAHWFATRFAGQVADAIEEYDVVERRSIVQRLLAMAAGMCAMVFAALALVAAVTGGALTVDRFVFNLGTLSLLGTSLAEIASSFGQQLGQSLYVKSFQEVLGLESRTHFPEQGKKPDEPDKGLSLELQNVRFGYPEGSGNVRREVIKGINLEVPAGEKWAMVGVNGAGKSTLNSLIVRLFDPDQGQVLIGGIAAREYDRQTLRRLVGCLPQDIRHYNLTVAEFIALGRAGEVPDGALVRWAAERSGASVFVEKYPKSYAQRLGRDYKGAEEPSGGQLQKLALASLLYMRAPLMVLDEPTAAIDPESARDFWNTLFNETPGQTVIFSTHYLGAVRRADCIVVLDDGKILDSGTHEELVGRCTTYRNLFESQARDYQN